MERQEDVLRPLNYTTLPGFRFHPTRDELLGYLKRKVEGIPPQVIPEANVYEVEPWSLSAHALDREAGRLFRLTKLKKQCPGATRAARQAGGGKWNPRAQKVICDSQNAVIGYENYLVYQTKELSLGKWSNTEWRMHEYSLPSEQYPSAEEEWVVCKITSKQGFNSLRGADELIEEPQTSFDPNRVDEPMNEDTTLPWNIRMDETMPDSFTDPDWTFWPVPPSGP